MQTLLAIDPSKANLGWATFIDGNLVKVGSESFKQHKTLTEFLHAYRTWFKKAVTGTHVVAYEEAKPRNMRHAEIHYGMLAIMHLEIEHATLIPIGWSTAKKRLAGNGHATKQDMLDAAIREYPTVGIDSHDQADAVAIGLSCLDVLNGNITPF